MFDVDFYFISPIQFTVAERCTPVPSVTNASPDSVNATKESHVTYTCHVGFVFPDGANNHTVSCNGLTWSITHTQCEGILCRLKCIDVDML